MKKNHHQFSTRVLHDIPKNAGYQSNRQGATQPPVIQSAAHSQDTAQNMSDLFAGNQPGHIYMRLSNPTNAALEEKIARLEEGRNALVTGSGMAAVTNACLTLLRAGDELVASSSLFMSTRLLFADIFKKYGITARFVDPCDLAAMESAITPKTRLMFIETIGNPRMDVPDIRALADIAHNHHLPLIVDNTLASPYLCRPIEFGADIVVHSTTKYLNGHGTATGGVIVDGGTFDWDHEKYDDFKPYLDKKEKDAFLFKVWKEHHINFGTTQAPWHAYLTMVGMDTLAVRMEKHLVNARQIADYLTKRPEVAWVNYPGLPDHPCHETVQKQFSGLGGGAMIAFGLADEAACFAFIDKLQLILHLANLGDCKSLVIHPWSSQYISFAETARRRLGITPDLVRLSVGIEDAGDICADIGRALDGLA
jgi:O-acetylhomoserine (thiol)-lyase